VQGIVKDTCAIFVHFIPYRSRHAMIPIWHIAEIAAPNFAQMFQEKLVRWIYFGNIVAN
jgi:hypothetical protein